MNMEKRFPLGIGEKRLIGQYCLVLTILFHFLGTLLTVILDERYISCSIKIQNNS